MEDDDDDDGGTHYPSPLSPFFSPPLSPSLLLSFPLLGLYSLISSLHLKPPPPFQSIPIRKRRRYMNFIFTPLTYRFLLLLHHRGRGGNLAMENEERAAGREMKTPSTPPRHSPPTPREEKMMGLRFHRRAAGLLPPFGFLSD